MAATTSARDESSPLDAPEQPAVATRPHTTATAEARLPLSRPPQNPELHRPFDSVRLICPPLSGREGLQPLARQTSGQPPGQRPARLAAGVRVLVPGETPVPEHRPLIQSDARPTTEVRGHPSAGRSSRRMANSQMLTGQSRVRPTVDHRAAARWAMYTRLLDMGRPVWPPYVQGPRPSGAHRHFHPSTETVRCGGATVHAGRGRRADHDRHDGSRAEPGLACSEARFGRRAGPDTLTSSTDVNYTASHPGHGCFIGRTPGP